MWKKQHLNILQYINKNTSTFPVGTWRNVNIIITSKRRRFDVVIVLLLRRVPVGFLRNMVIWNLQLTRLTLYCIDYNIKQLLLVKGRINFGLTKDALPYNLPFKGLFTKT